VPRFFFHIHDDVVSHDDEGLELPDADAAREQAMRGIRAMICDQVMEGRLALHHRVEVEDEAGAKVAAFDFADALRLERP
jgi:hypothetical protein